PRAPQGGGAQGGPDPRGEAGTGLGCRAGRGARARRPDRPAAPRARPGDRARGRPVVSRPPGPLAASPVRLDRRAAHRPVRVPRPAPPARRHPAARAAPRQEDPTMRYRVPFSPDRPESRYKARVQFVRSFIGEGAGGTLYTTPRGSLAIEFDAPSAADARRELARRIRPLDPRPVRGASLPLYASANYRAGLPDWARRREHPAPAWWDDGALLALARRLPLFRDQLVADLVGDVR